jgi:hypothetical protein
MLASINMLIFLAPGLDNNAALGVTINNTIGLGGKSF